MPQSLHNRVELPYIPPPYRGETCNRLPPQPGRGSNTPSLFIPWRTRSDKLPQDEPLGLYSDVPQFILVFIHSFEKFVTVMLNNIDSVIGVL